MAIKWIEGWRYRGGATELALDYTIAGAGSLAVAELAARRAGCYAATLTDKTVQRAVSISTGARVLTGFAYKWTSGASTIVEFKEGATVHCSLAITAGGVLTAYRGTDAGTSLGTGSTLVAGTVYYIDVDVTVHDTTGIFSVYLDDVSDIALTSQDTRETGTPIIDSILYRGPTGGAAFADLWIVDPSDTAGKITRFTSAQARVDCRVAIANGAKADFTASTGSNYACVDDDGYDGDTTYVQSQVAAARDLFPVTQMTHNPALVYAMQVHVIARKVDSEARTVKPVLRSPSATSSPGNAVALTTSYASIVDIWEDSGALDDGGAFTQQGFNARQFGYEIA